MVEEEETGVFTAARGQAVAGEGGGAVEVEEYIAAVAGGVDGEEAMVAAEGMVIVEVAVEMELEGTDAKET